MIPGKTYTPAAILAILWRRKLMLILPVILAALAATLIARRLPDLFRSETTILVVPQRVPESYVRSTVTASVADRLRTITQQILSRTRLEQIIKEFDLYAAKRANTPIEGVVAEMRDQIDLQISRSDSFQLAFVYTDAVTAMRVTERLAALYIEENIRDREVLAEGTNQFLEAQLDDARRRLLEQEKKIESYRLRHSGELPSQMPSNLQVIQNTQMQIQSLLETVNRDRDRRSVIDRMIADLSATQPVRPEAVQGATGALPAQPLTAAEQHELALTQLRALESRLTTEHPDVVRLRRQVADLAEKVKAGQLEKQADHTATEARGAGATSAAELARRAQLASLRSERDALDRQIDQRLKEEQSLRATIADYQSRVEMVPTRESEMIGLTRDYDTLQSSYRALLTKKEESQIAANLERQQSGEQFRILDPARVPESPFSPNRLRIQIGGMVGGLLAGLAIIALLELRDSTLRTAADVVQLFDLPVLAVVPIVVTPEQIRRRRLLKLGLTAATLAVASALAVGWSRFF